MELSRQELMYEFYVKDMAQTEALKQYSDHVVKEIKSTYGWDTEIQIHIEPECKDKSVFSISMCVYGLGEAIYVRKEGKQVLAVLRKVRKSVLRQIHRLNQKRMTYRKKTFSDRNFIS